MGGNLDSQGHDQHKATERSMTLGRDWVRQNAKQHMTYDQFLNQTERGRRKRKGGGVGEEEEGGKQGSKRVAAIQVLCFYFHI